MLINRYINFLCELLAVEFALFILVSLISLFTIIDLLFSRKRSLYFCLQFFFRNTFFMVLLLFIFYLIDPIDSSNTIILIKKIIYNFPNKDIWLYSLAGVDILLFLILLCKPESFHFNIEEDSTKVINWCVHNYPKSGIKKYPNIIINNESSDNYGEYNFLTKDILIFPKNIKSKKDLINTLIHEYFHFYLDHGKSSQEYHNKLNEVGYDKHPIELICNTSAEKLTQLYFEQHES